VIPLLANHQPSKAVQNDETMMQLIRSGILMFTNDQERSVKFTSPLAKRFFCGRFYRKRDTSNEFENLLDLAKSAVQCMSARALKQSAMEQKDRRAKNSEFPTEATLQHLFMKSLFLLTTVGVQIFPELTRLNPPSVSSSGNSATEIDFFLFNGFKWGIELLLLGNDIDKEFAQFPKIGKYKELNCTDNIVIDLRRGTVNQHVLKHDKKMTVFFSKDFKTCSCIYGLSSDVFNLTVSP
jgi:hypothetical protein